LPAIEVFRKKADKALHKELVGFEILDYDFVPIDERAFDKFFEGAKFS